MSQIFHEIGAPPSSAVDTLTANNFVVVGPDGANNINVFAATSSDFNVLEFQTVGNAGTNTVTATQFNILTGSASGTGAGDIDVITFDLGGTDGVYTMDITMVVFDDTNNVGAGYNIFGTIRTIAGTATLVGTPDKIVNEDASLATGDGNMIASANNFILRYTIPAGVTASASGYAHYTKQE